MTTSPRTYTTLRDSIDSVSALTAPVNIGARSNGSRFGALNLYGLVVIDRALTDVELMQAEAWMAAKCGVVL